MRALNLFIFLILFFGIISSVNAQTSCTYRDNLKIVLSSYLTHNFEMAFPGSGVANYGTTFDWKLSNTYYFPTHIIWECNKTVSSVLYVAYKILDKYGDCTIDAGGVTLDVGFSGVILDEDNSNEQIGGWVYYKFKDNRAEFYASYMNYPVGHTLYYKNTYAFPINIDYCQITNYNIYFSRSSSGIVVNTYNPMLNNFIFHGARDYWYNAQIAYSEAPSNTAYNCTLTMNYITYYTLNNLNITYYPNSKVLNVSFTSNFPGYIGIKNVNRNYTFAFEKNTPFNAYIPYINYTLNIYDNNSNLLYSIYLPKAAGLTCLDQPDIGVYSVRLKDAADNLILNFKIIYANQTFVSDANGVVNLPKLTDATVTVIPFFRPDLAFNTTLTTQPGITYIIAPYYVYTIKIKVFYIPLTGEKLPAGFNYAFTGQEYADKVNLTNPNVTVGGTANDNVTVQLLAGNYELTLKTALTYLGADIVTRQINYSLSLFDDNYYRELTWYTGLFGDSIDLNASNLPILSVIVIDQNSKPVANAYIYLNDTNNTNLAIKPTDENGNAVFYVRNGQSYTVSVYYNGVFKALKTINYPADQLAVQVNFQIYIAPGEVQQGVPANLTQEQVQNQITSILTIILTNYAIWAFIFIIIFAAYAAKISGSPEIGILTAVICIGVFTFIVPWLPVQILALLGVLAGVLLGLKVVRGRE